MINNALIVLNYNDYETTLNFISQVSKCDNLKKIIIVDNCSTDNSYVVLKKSVSSRIDVIQTERNGGYAYGNNFGCRYAIEKYDPKILFISNPDVEFDDNAVECMQSILIQNVSVGLVAPLVNHGYNAWNAVGFWGIMESLFMCLFSCHKRRLKDWILRFNTPYVNVKVVEGSFFAISSDAYKKCNGFDERTFLYYEEVILSHRLHSIGLSEAITTRCRYNHYHSVSIRKRYGNKTKAYANYYGSILVYLNSYVGIGKIKRWIFDICYALGYIERLLYDFFVYVL